MPVKTKRQVTFKELLHIVIIEGGISMKYEHFSGGSLLEIGCILIAVFLIIGWSILLYKRHKKLQSMRKWLAESTVEERERYINGALGESGFLYDGRQDIFYAAKEPWQKKYGYSRIYDEAAALTGMIIDCEPIYFDYDGRRWMLELWKGQYGMSLGGEIGLYQSMRGDGSLFHGVEEEDFIGMHMELYAGGRHLLGRREEHWWLTGFAVGKSGSPENMQMAVSLTFLNRLMCRSFVDGLRRAGYRPGEYQVQGERVRFWFAIPHTHQPSTRGPVMDRIRLWWFHSLCHLFEWYTRKYQTSAEKLIYLQIKAPWLFAIAIRMAKGKELFERNRNYEGISQN